MTCGCSVIEEVETLVSENLTLFQLISHRESITRLEISQESPVAFLVNHTTFILDGFLGTDWLSICLANDVGGLTCAWYFSGFLSLAASSSTVIWLRFSALHVEDLVIVNYYVFYCHLDTGD